MNSKNLNVESENSDEISIKDLILIIKEWNNYLFSKWLVILMFIVIGALLGFAYASSKKPVYTATTTFVLEDGASGTSALGNLGGLASMAGIDLGGGAGGIFQGDNILELYKSRIMIEKTLLTEVIFNGKKQLLIDRYIDFNNLRQSWASNPQLTKLDFQATRFENSTLSSPILTRLKDSVLREIVNDINNNYLDVAKPDKKLSIIKANIKATDEIFAKAFNDEIVKNVNDFYFQTKTKKSLENVAILQQKTDSVRAVMNGAIYASAAISDATPNLNPTRQIQRVAPLQRSQFNVETNKEVLSELVKNLEISKITLRKEAPLIQVIDKPVFPLEKAGFGKVKGMVIGGFLAGFLAVLLLFIKRVLKGIMD